MKKLLSIVLALCLMLTTVAGALTVFAAEDSQGNYVPDSYDGIFTQESADIFGFEGATIGAGGTYQFDKGGWGAHSATEYRKYIDASDVEITDEASASGKNSLKVTMGNSGNFVWLKSRAIGVQPTLAAGEWYITANVRATADFDGDIMIEPGFATGNYWGQFAVAKGDWDFGNAEGYTRMYPTLGNTEYNITPYTTDHFSKMNSFRVNAGFKALDNDGFSNWAANPDSTFEIMVDGTKGTVWIDDISLELRNQYDGNLQGEFAEYGQNKSNCNGGMEGSYQYWFKQSGFGGESDKNHLEQDKTTSHTGVSSSKMTLINDTTGIGTGGAMSMGWLLDESKIDSSKGYYVEAWVKLGDDFNGRISSKFGKGALWESLYTYWYISDQWMLTNAARDVAGNTVYSDHPNYNGGGVRGSEYDGRWFKIRTNIIPAATISDWFASDTSTNFNLYLCVYGTGTIWIDDVDFVAVDDNTVQFSDAGANSIEMYQAPDVALNTIQMNTVNTNTDIWYTTDDSDPRYSTTAKLYDANNKLTLCEATEILAVAFDRSTGKFGNVMPLRVKGINTQSYHLNADFAGVSAVNGIKTVDSNYINLVFASWLKQDIDVSFKLTTSGIDGDVTAKLLLIGSGITSKEFVINNVAQNKRYASVGQDGYVAKVNADGTVDVSAKLTGLDSCYSGMVLELSTDGTTGTAAMSDFTFKAADGDNYISPVSVSNNTEETNYLNYYFDGQQVCLYFDMTNNTGYIQNGALTYEVKYQDGTSVADGAVSYNPLTAGNQLTKQELDLNDAVQKYGVYTVSFTYVDALNRTFDAGKIVFAKVSNNGKINSDSKTGVSSHVLQWGSRYSGMSNAQLEETFDVMFNTYADLGVKYLRVDVMWNDVLATEGGSYAMPAWWDAVLTAASDYDISIIPIFNGYNQYYTALSTAEHAAKFAEFAGEVVDMFADYNVYGYECVNEPNLYLSASDYAVILRDVYTAVKDANEDVLVFAGNVSHHGGGYLEAMVTADADILDCMDIWSVHPYACTAAADKTYESADDAIFGDYFASLKSNYLDAKGIELWCGEFGYTVCDTQYGVSSEEAAAYTVRAYLLMENSGIDNFVQYTVDGDGNNYYIESNFGIFETGKKHTSVAINAFAKMTAGFDFVAADVDGANGVYKYHFNNGEDDLWAIWSVGDTDSINMTVNADEYTVFDLYGNAVQNLANGVETAVAIGAEPVYITYNGNFIAEPLAYENVINGDMEGTETFGFDAYGTAEFDTEEFYDGEQSFHVSTVAAEGIYQARPVFKSQNLLNGDFNVASLYKLRFKMKATAGAKAQIYSMTKFAAGDGNGEYYVNRHPWYGETLVQTNLNRESALSRKWTTYETDAFSILGKQMIFVLNIKSDDQIDVWIDNIEMVPVEGSCSENAAYDYSFNADTDEFTLSVTPDSGYIVYSGNFTICGNAYEATMSEPASDGTVTFTYKDVHQTVYMNNGSVAERFMKINITHAAPDTDYIQNNSLEDAWPGAIAAGGTGGKNNEYAYHGENSLKVTSTVATGNNGGIDFTMTANTSGFDVNTRYVLRAMFKGDGNAKVATIFRERGYFGNTKLNVTHRPDGNIHSDTFNFVGTAISDAGSVMLSDDWQQFTSQPFTVLGDRTEFTFCFRSLVQNTSFWVDNFEIVPVTNSSANHGKVTASYDSETGNVILTCIADEGYVPGSISSMTWAGSGSNNALTLVDHPSADVEAYAVNFNGHSILNNDGFKAVNATFKAKSVTLQGDANNDGVLSIKDLVRLKKYMAGTTEEINLVNVLGTEKNIAEASDVRNLALTLLGVQ